MSINTFLWPSPDICARTFPLGATTTNVGQEFTPSSLHKYMSPSFTTFEKVEGQISYIARKHTVPCAHTHAKEKHMIVTPGKSKYNGKRLTEKVIFVLENTHEDIYS